MHQSFNNDFLKGGRLAKNPTLNVHTDYKASTNFKNVKMQKNSHLRIKKTSNLFQRRAYHYGFMQNHSNDLWKALNNVTNCFVYITSISCYY